MMGKLSAVSKKEKGFPLLRLLVLALVFCAMGTSSEALEARKVTSLDTETYSSSPGDFCQVGENLFFRADDGFHGSELWKVEGPDAAPVMVADLNPNGSSSLGDLVEMGGDLFFFTYNMTEGLELWTSDGTREGTSPVKAVTSAEILHDPHLTQAGDKLFFLADDGTNGLQLWTSDGTESGTVSLARFSTTEEPFFTYQELCAVGDEVYFVADDGTHGFELWKSDGSEAGTLLVTDLEEGEAPSFPRDLTAVGMSLAFWANEGTNGYQVYRLTGDSTLPVRVTSFESDYPRSLFGGPDDSFFIFTRGNSGNCNIWELGPSAASADLAATLSGDVGEEVQADPVINLQGEMLFTFRKTREDSVTRDRDITTELWSLGTGGQEARRVKVLGDAEYRSEDYPAVLLDGKVFFLTRAYAATGRGILWKTDGTEEGTAAITDAEEGPSVLDLHAFGDVLFLEAGDPHHGAELWTSDGTPEGTVLHADINRRVASEFKVWNDTLYFGAWDAAGPGLWASDGSSAGTRRVALTPPASGYCPMTFFDGGEKLFFYSDDNMDGVRLWATDGTEAGTSGLADAGPYVRSIMQEQLGGNHYFIRQEFENRGTGYAPELWKTDGTAEGTVPVADLAEGFPGLNFCLVRAGERLVFDVFNEENDELQLWTSDGTAGGTSPLDVSLPEGLLRELTVTDSGDVFFPVYGRSGDMTLWKSDGTAEGTVQVALLGTEGEVQAADLTPAANKVFFRLYRSETREIELWVTEGTDETTRRVGGIDPDGNEEVESLTALGDRIFFTADDGTHGRELWISDGTEEGTFMVSDIDPEGSSNPADLTVLGAASGLTAADSTGCGGSLYFTADDGRHGRELWSTDGTEEGTCMVCNTYRGDSNPANPVLLVGSIYFTTVDGKGSISLMKAVEGSSGCSTSGLPALGLLLLPLLGLLKR